MKTWAQLSSWSSFLFRSSRWTWISVFAYCQYHITSLCQKPLICSCADLYHLKLKKFWCSQAIYIYMPLKIAIYLLPPLMTLKTQNTFDSNRAIKFWSELFLLQLPLFKILSFITSSRWTSPHCSSSPIFQTMLITTCRYSVMSSRILWRHEMIWNLKEIMDYWLYMNKEMGEMRKCTVLKKHHVLFIKIEVNSIFELEYKLEWLDEMKKATAVLFRSSPQKFSSLPTLRLTFNKNSIIFKLNLIYQRKSKKLSSFCSPP